MNETNFRAVAIKSVAIIGFFATIILLIWLVTEGIKRAPSTFESLATIVESISDYRAVHELTIGTENSVVNSNESFRISWTDVKQSGEYNFRYTCTAGVDLFTHDEGGSLVPISCTDTLTLPATVHGLLLNITSEEMRLIDVPLSITFTNDAKSETLESTIKITIVNATIPIKEQSVVIEEVETEEEPEVAPTPVVEPKPVVTEVTPKPSNTPQKPIMTLVYPQSNPNGYIDLQITTLGSGILRDGIFMYTAKYDIDLQNSIKFDIRNIGTKTSRDWTFTTVLPDGTVYKSPSQLGLKPNEHVEYTMGFSIDSDIRDRFVEIKNTVHTSGDNNTTNNTSIWSVALKR